LKKRLRNGNPNGSLNVDLGFGHVFDKDAATWRVEPIELIGDLKDRPAFDIEFPAYVYKEGTPNPSLTPNEDPEFQAAQAAEISRLIAEKEAADRAKEKDEAFSNMPVAEHPAQVDVSLELRHEEQAPRN